MIPDALTGLLTGTWGLLIMAALVIGDAFTVVIPGEVAVTAVGALAVQTGRPPLWVVIAVAAGSALIGDTCCYLIGRTVGVERWGWMRHRRVRAAIGSARRRLDRGTATVLFTARFIPFARLAVNLVAGAARTPPLRYLSVAAVAGTGWAVYQAALGAAIALIRPGGPIVTVLVSAGAAVGIGLLIDLAVSRARPTPRNRRP
ncbi:MULTISPECIES: VTT domain-containing protein [unclassified Microbacterium]|uniref:DedA family protein n=1 Tax=unclassified Microbacterium TaxID=2609290 RepID=UPI002FCCEBDA